MGEQTPFPTALGGEWLESDGLGGFASGTAGGVRTRRYHALLLPALAPPSGRVVLVNGLDVEVVTKAGTFPLSAQHYQPGVTIPEPPGFLRTFHAEPWPTWRFEIPGGHVVVQEFFLAHEGGTAAVSWRLEGGDGSALLRVRPMLSGRDYHGLHRENAAFRFDAEVNGEYVTWKPYADRPAVRAQSNGVFSHAPEWYRNFLYTAERERGLDDTEDLALPGRFTFDLLDGEAVLLLGVARDGAGAGDQMRAGLGQDDRATLKGAYARFEALRAAESKRRAAFASPLHRAADQYLVRRGAGRTIIAGYPWFTDWGRDTFIALRGLCLAAGRVEEALEILLEWSGHVSRGMLPNRFPDHGEAPEYNSVDASLWFVVAVSEAIAAAGERLSAGGRKKLQAACVEIARGYRDGTRHGIAMDPADGLMLCGEPGVQLTWMDAKVGDWVVTPRIGKPVEIQALWINALHIVAEWDKSFKAIEERALDAFRAEFWNEERGCLYDVIDDNRASGAKDARLRPNQVFAVGGLPVALLDGDRARRVVETVERELWTPVGLRSLARGEKDYAPRYEGGVWQRDGAYHQGTVWPWLLGPFVEAWLRVNGGTPKAKAEARRRFVEPLLRSLPQDGAMHVAEIADAEAPHAPRGCPFQAWSVGELLRIEGLLNAVAPRAVEAVR